MKSKKIIRDRRVVYYYGKEKEGSKEKEGDEEAPLISSR